MFGSWKQPDMQALQIAIFLQHLHKFVKSVEKDEPVPWIISGDFNTYPYFPLYDIISTGNVTDEGMERLNPNKYKYPQVVKKAEVYEVFVYSMLLLKTSFQQVASRLAKAVKYSSFCYFRSVYQSLFKFR